MNLKKVKPDKGILLLQLLWLTGYLNISYLSGTVNTLLQAATILLGGIYVLKRIRQVEMSYIRKVSLFPFAVLFTSLLRCLPDSPLRFIKGVLFAVVIWEFLLLAQIVGKRKEMREIARSLLHASFLYLVPTVISVLVVGAENGGSERIFFIGTKFAVAYFLVMVLCLIGLTSKEKHTAKGGFGLPFWLFAIGAFLLDLYMRAGTGLVMLLFVVAMVLLNHDFSFRKNHGNGVVGLLRRPGTVVVMMIVAGGFIFVAYKLFEIPKVLSLLNAVNKTSTFQSRLIIYEHLVEIVLQKFILGYGHDSSIVLEVINANAQNGLIQIIVYYGVIGAATLIYLIFSCVKKGSRNGVSDARSDLVLFCIYAFIVGSTVEICYRYQICILAAFYVVQCMQNRSSSKESIGKTGV